jgi:hypothetical protein
MSIPKQSPFTISANEIKRLMHFPRQFSIQQKQTLMFFFSYSSVLAS